MSWAGRFGLDTAAAIASLISSPLAFPQGDIRKILNMRLEQLITGSLVDQTNTIIVLPAGREQAITIVGCFAATKLFS
jgi:hypothetical protein